MASKAALDIKEMNIVVIAQHLVWDTDQTLTSLSNSIFKVMKNMDRNTYFAVHKLFKMFP